MPLFINFKNLIFKIVKKEEDFLNAYMSFSYIIKIEINNHCFFNFILTPNSIIE